MTKCIAAFDLGNLAGYFIMPYGSDVAFGTLDLVPQRWEGGGMRYLRFQQELSRLHSIYKFTLVVFEEVRMHVSTASAHAYGGYKSHIMAWCEANGVPYSSVPWGTWKKALTGQGNASKDVIQACVRRLGFNVNNYDEADACGIALYAEQEFGR